MTRLLALVCVLLLSAGLTMAQDYPNYSNLHVNDYADLLNDQEERALRNKLTALRRDHGIEFTVLTIQRMSDYGHSGAIEPFATGLFNNWGIGDAARNDGVLMLISRFDRTMRLEVGAGYGSSMDAPMKQIIDDVFIPHFRRDDYAGGIIAGADAVIARLVPQSGVDRQTWTVTERELADYGQVELTPANPVIRFFQRLGWWLAAILSPLLAIPVWLFRRWRRYRPRICPKDGVKMYVLNEVADDVHLNEGQRVEERLKSVDYDVWCCPRCAHIRTESYGAWFTRLSVCRACGYKTAEGDSTIISHATENSTGRRRIDYTCANCHESWSETKIIPRKTKSSSSSSSFGGGSSSGVGASGSW